VPVARLLELTARAEADGSPGCGGTLAPTGSARWSPAARPSRPPGSASRSGPRTGTLRRPGPGTDPAGRGQSRARASRRSGRGCRRFRRRGWGTRGVGTPPSQPTRPPARREAGKWVTVGGGPSPAAAAAVGGATHRSGCAAAVDTAPVPGRPAIRVPAGAGPLSGNSARIYWPSSPSTGSGRGRGHRPRQALIEPVRGLTTRGTSGRSRGRLGGTSAPIGPRWRQDSPSPPAGRSTARCSASPVPRERARSRPGCRFAGPTACRTTRRRRSRSPWPPVPAGTPGRAVTGRCGSSRRLR